MANRPPSHGQVSAYRGGWLVRLEFSAVAIVADWAVGSPRVVADRLDENI